MVSPSSPAETLVSCSGLSTRFSSRRCAAHQLTRLLAALRNTNVIDRAIESKAVVASLEVFHFDKVIRHFDRLRLVVGEDAAADFEQRELTILETAGATHVRHLNRFAFECMDRLRGRTAVGDQRPCLLLRASDRSLECA